MHIHIYANNQPKENRSKLKTRQKTQHMTNMEMKV